MIVPSAGRTRATPTCPLDPGCPRLRLSDNLQSVPPGHDRGEHPLPRQPPLTVSQYPVPDLTLLRSISCRPPFLSSVAHASAMSCASVPTIARLSVCLTSARMIVTSCALGGSE